MHKEKTQKMILWTCEKWAVKKCLSECPCQMMLPKKVVVDDEWCAMHNRKANWVPVPTSKLTV